MSKEPIEYPVRYPARTEAKMARTAANRAKQIEDRINKKIALHEAKDKSAELAVIFDGKEVTVTDLYQSKMVEAADALYCLIKDPNTVASARVAAIKEWNDRAYGKAPASVSVTHNKKTESSLDVANLSTQTLEEINKVALRVVDTGDK